VTIRLGAGNGQFAAAYMDYDLNVAASGSFQDVGSVHGTAPAGVSFEMGDPAGFIFGDFAANGLTNVNGVAVGSAPPSACCDVAWALGVGGINVAPGSTVLLTFLVSTNQPTSGFYLQQTNTQDGESIYFTESLSISAVPLPNSLLLFGSALGGGLVFVRRRREAARVRAHPLGDERTGESGCCPA
jgi:hypothetical protein